MQALDLGYGDEIGTDVNGPESSAVDDADGQPGCDCPTTAFGAGAAVVGFCLWRRGWPGEVREGREVGHLRPGGSTPKEEMARR